MKGLGTAEWGKSLFVKGRSGFERGESHRCDLDKSGREDYVYNVGTVRYLMFKTQFSKKRARRFYEEMSGVVSCFPLFRRLS